MPAKHHPKLWLALSLLMAIAVACNLMPTPTPTPTPTPAATPTPLPPIAPRVIDHTPQRGDELAPSGAITVYFDTPMDRVSVETAFSIQPKVPGAFKWQDDATVAFAPSKPLERAARYTVNIAATAKSKYGLALPDAVSFAAETVGFLEVTQALPAPDAAGVEVNAVITVMFNRPVVPLTGLADQAALPNPLTLQPEVAGKGEWLNTSIFVFRPQKSLAGGQTYTALVKAGLQDTTGGLLKEDYSWQFTTLAPQVVDFIPAFDQTDVPLTQPITVTFNQPMDHASTEAAFTLKSAAGKISGAFRWAEDDQTLGFVPAASLALGSQYEVSISTAALAASKNAPLTPAFNSAFSTVKAPAILSTSPADGDTTADNRGGFQIYFASPMDVKTLAAHIEILPTPTEVYSSWNSWESGFYLSWNVQPSTAYTVTLKPGMADPYGNTIAEGQEVHFTTRASDPEAYFTGNGELNTYNAYTDTVFYITTLNVNKVDFALYRVSLEQFAKLTGPNSWEAYDKYKPQDADAMRKWTVNIEAAENARLLTRVSVAEAGGALPPGVYYLQMTAPGVAYNSHQLMIVSGANLTVKATINDVLVWATDLNSGQPIPNYPVALYTYDFNLITRGQTDAQGVFRTDLPKAKADASLWDAVYAVSEGGPERTAFAATLSNWGTGIDPWDFGVPSQYYAQQQTSYLYTDRPLYRPGQTVYFKGILRKENDARFSLPDVGQALVAINNDQGEQVYSNTLTVSAFGSFSGEFKLAEEAGLGYYNINVTSLDGNTNYGGVSFSVAEYRKPEFQVKVTSPVTQVVQGETIPVAVDANFFFGGAVSNAKVHWSVLAADYFFDYKGQGYYDFYDFDYSSGESGPTYGTYGRLISEEDGKTDAQGHATLNVKADLSDKGYSQLYTIEATVTNINGQQVSGRVEVAVHQGKFYIGLRPEQYVAQAGQLAKVNLIAVDWNSQPVPNQKLHVVYNDHQWNCALEKDPDTGSDSWACHVKDTEVASEDVTTDGKGLAQGSFTPPKGGVYQIKATGIDSAGHKVTSSTIIWVWSNDYVSWRQDNNDRIALVTDRKSYKPGDTAEILIPAPFQGEAQALITIERGHIIKHEVVKLTSNSTVYKLPITADYAPDVFFSVVIVKGVDENNPAPAFKMGLAKLSVSPEQQQLKVTLTPDKDKVGPRDTVTYVVKATDYAGKPVQAEFSLSVVDLALLSLSTPNSGPIMDAFYSERGLGVRTATGLTLSMDRVNIQAAKAKGGGGGAEAGFNEVRSQFLDTAYWKAVVTTDQNGQASVAVTLPDNLTTWRLDARGITADTLVGQSTVDIMATKDLLVSPLTPRFFVVGDIAQLSAVVYNNTDKDIDTTVTLKGTGVKLSTEFPAAQTVKVKAHDRAQVTWSVTAQDVPTVDLTFSAEGGGLKDASKPTLGIPPDQLLPVYKYTAPETTATAGQLTDANSILEAISLPRRFEATQGELNIELDPSLAAGMTGGLDYLKHYPYECTEQTVSRFLPNVLTYRALKDLGLAKPELEAELKTQVGVGLQRLYARQHVDGGWGWWTNDQSNPFTSAYVIFGLAKAKQAGFAVNESVLSNGLSYLQNQIIRPETSTHSWELNQQAFILYVMAEAGTSDISANKQLFEHRTLLSNYARAYLALAFNLADPKDTAPVKALLSDFNNAAIMSATGAHWEEKDTDWWNMNTNTRSTAIVLDALARLDPKNQLIPNVVRWLMVARKGDAWETTQETAWSLISLTDWMVVSGELKANYDYNVTLNGQALTTGSVNADNLRDPVKLKVAVADLFKDQANRLVINRGAGDGRLYYTANLNIYLPVEEVRAASRGVMVSRQYTIKSADCGGPKQPACPAVTSAKAGQDIQVKVTLIAPNDLYYVVLEDPIPAGTEAVDTSLQTTSVVGEAPQLNYADPLYYGWGWWWFSNTDLRDEKVVLFATYLPKGTYEYTYVIHASMPGVYKVIPTHANEFYFPEVFGRGDGMIFTIKP